MYTYHGLYFVLIEGRYFLCLFFKTWRKSFCSEKDVRHFILQAVFVAIYFICLCIQAFVNRQIYKKNAPMI